MSAQSDEQRTSSGLGIDVYQSIYALLISQEIEPGARMAVDELTRRLGVSQTPVRHALATLEAEGLVTRTHLVGYRAGELLSRKQFEDLFDVRLLFEPQAARWAAEQRDPEHVAEMRRTQDEMKSEAFRDGAIPYGIFARHDGALHGTVVAASGNGALQDVLTRLHPHVHLFRLFIDRAVTHDALEEHETIVEAIASGDPQQAAQAMRTHLKRSRKRLLKAFT